MQHQCCKICPSRAYFPRALLISTFLVTLNSWPTWLELRPFDLGQQTNHSPTIDPSGPILDETFSWFLENHFCTLEIWNNHQKCYHLEFGKQSDLKNFGSPWHVKYQAVYLTITCAPPLSYLSLHGRRPILHHFNPFGLKKNSVSRQRNVGWRKSSSASGVTKDVSRSAVLNVGMGILEAPWDAKYEKQWSFETGPHCQC